MGNEKYTEILNNVKGLRHGPPAKNFQENEYWVGYGLKK